MTYSEAEKHALTVKWKIGFCTQGESCWCRTVIPEEQITDNQGSDVCIIDSGCVSKQAAEHIVKIHNESL